jgi:hypothetical protein
MHIDETEHSKQRSDPCKQGMLEENDKAHHHQPTCAGRAVVLMPVKSCTVAAAKSLGAATFQSVENVPSSSAIKEITWKAEQVSRTFLNTADILPKHPSRFRPNSHLFQKYTHTY